MPLVVPALVAADFARLGDALRMIKAAGASMVHVDVADGHFAPEITLGQPVIASLRRATDLVLDVHLLIEYPERYVGEFVSAGADQISVHAEVTRPLHSVLDLIRSRGVKAGLAVSPATPLASVAELFSRIDVLTVLCAEPSGRGPFLAESFAKLRAAVHLRATSGLKFAIQAEGGIGVDQVQQVVLDGADILVLGSDIFDSSDPKSRLRDMIAMSSCGVRYD
jgi:ribulose-phosphate 3-epimerase